MAIKNQITIGTLELSTSPLPQFNRLWAAASDGGLWALEFGIAKEAFIQNVLRRGKVTIVEDDQALSAILEQVAEYLTGQRSAFEMQIDWRGMTAFQVQVRRTVMAVPFGQTATYGQIAEQLGKPGGARAVGRANATNPIPLVIPCHRIVGSNGELTGYGGVGGVETKRWLLALENEDRRD